MASIRLERVRKSYRGLTVIPELDLSIADGEFFTFVGPSGCGKSTLLQMIAGLEPVSGGNIWFDDVRVNDLSPAERDVAMVFQSYALYPHMSVSDNLAFPLRMRKVDAKTVRREVARVAEVLGLAGKLDARPRELSGGQRQRVALGRAIIRDPKVFLLDEPLSNLDARLRLEMREELKALHRRLGTTTVYVTHDQGEALGLSDRLAVLREGRVQHCGPALEVYLSPANVFVAGFMGSMPMNLFPARPDPADPSRVVCGGRLLQPPMARRPPSSTGLLLGFRPEDARLSGEAGEGALEARVEYLEPAGSFLWAEFRWDGERGRGRAELDACLEPGQPAWVRVAPEKLLVFDADSGERL